MGRKKREYRFDGVWRLYGFQEHDKFPSINIVDCFIFSTRCVVVGIAGGISYIFRREWNLNGHAIHWIIFHNDQWVLRSTLCGAPNKMTYNWRIV